MMKPENFFSIDLELNKNEENKTNRIIQVGCAFANISTPEDIKTFSWYLNPQEPITPFISQLTGITDEIIQEKSVDHQTVAKELGELLKVYEIHTSPVVWGGGKGNDATELKDEFDERGIEFKFFGHRVIDVKTIFVFNQILKQRTKKSGLSKAMASYGLKFDGRQHNAEYDALNTLRFFFHLVYRQKTFEDFKSSMEQMK
jgi:inhibitor of KinA sporulation pathway (predicted exonuclease)